MNHGIFDFASPLQMQYYTRLIFELRSSFLTAFTAVFPCCCARSSCTHLFENVLMMLGMNLCTQNSVLLKNVILSADHFILSTKHHMNGMVLIFNCIAMYWLFLPTVWKIYVYIVTLRLIEIDSIFVISNAISIPSQVVHLWNV